ncbi:MAG: sigma-70 family RNA polymerase sigma factor [Planctomycetes bacterium]|nr:sigma-70 family RNA polymerase sigma factor [Planctomycetota bacterium]MCB9889184.1 sigma-70 family RNA polymerase sigma factor [Planctomycetota bacterium]
MTDPDAPREWENTVRAAEFGDRAAVGDLLARNYQRLCAFVRIELGGALAARESVEDVVQSVCREVLHDVDRLEVRSEPQFRRFLLLEATRKILARHRSLHRQCRDVRREHLAGIAATGLLADYATFCTPSRVASAREEIERIEAALAELPERQRVAVSMVRMLGLSYPEAAEALECTEPAARALVARGLALLSAKLGE